MNTEESVNEMLSNCDKVDMNAVFRLVHKNSDGTIEEEGFYGNLRECLTFHFSLNDELTSDVV